MGYSFIRFLGALIHWLLNGCKTKLMDEIDGNLDPTWGKSYDLENLIIGILTSAIFITIISFLISYKIL